MVVHKFRDWMRESHVGAIAVAICVASSVSSLVEAVGYFGDAAFERLLNKQMVGFFAGLYPVQERSWFFAETMLGLLIATIVVVLPVVFAAANWIFPKTMQRPPSPEALSNPS